MDTSKYLSNYVRASDMEGKNPLTLTITSAEEELIGPDKDKKLVLYAQELEQGIVLNKACLRTIHDLFGTESTKWVGKEMVLFHDPNVLFSGKLVGGLRFRGTN